jgi:hypothetical protein
MYMYTLLYMLNSSKYQNCLYCLAVMLVLGMTWAIHKLSFAPFFGLLCQLSFDHLC